MNAKQNVIDYSDIPEITDFSRARKNPHASVIKEKGYSITIHYTPEETASADFDDTEDIIQALVSLMSVSERKSLLKFIRNNYELPCSPNVWDVLDATGNEL